MFGIGKIMHQAMQGLPLSQVVQNAVGGLGNPMSNASKLIGGAMKAMGGQAQAQTEKALYLAVLAAAMEKASTQTAFNMETAINDLWIKLGNIRNDKQSVGKIAEMVGQQQQMQQQLTQTLQKLGQMSQQIVQNLKN